MSSLKMTFSLASLVLILGLVFAIAPVMAQEAVVEIDKYFPYSCHYCGHRRCTVLVLSLAGLERRH